MPTVTVSKEIDAICKKKLFNVTVKGRWWEAESILKNNKHAAMEAITDDGNTMLELAVGTGQNDFVEWLMRFITDSEQIEKKNSDGRTALHIAAIVGNTPAAKLLVNKRKELVGIADDKEIIPLFSAYYNMKFETFAYLLEHTEIKGPSPSLGFVPSSDPLQPKVDLLVTLIFTKQYDLASIWVNKCSELVTRDDQVLMAIVETFPSELGFVEALIYPRLNKVYRKLFKRCYLLFHSYEFVYSIAKGISLAKRGSKSIYYCWLSPKIVIILLVPVAMFYLLYQLINLFILVLFYPFLLLHLILWNILATVLLPIKCIDKKKTDYINAKKILKSVCKDINSLNISDSNHPCYSKPLLEAARQGSHKVVKEILVGLSKTIGSKLINGNNIIQLAVINRSEKVYNCISHFVERMDLSIVDSSKNNLLHLVGRLPPAYVLSSTTGAAMQLQRELQWRKEVQKFMLPTELVEKNTDMETPEMVFTREHKALMVEAENWMKKTSESCIITVALITTIVFAAAVTVPGGSNQETGFPMFRNEIPFTIFAISDAISLFASCTALLVFLSILTSVRFSEQDFLVSLPRRLIIGLCALLVSTIAMIVAFCAIFFLVFCEQRTWKLAPIVGLACFPIAIVVTLEVPLVADLYLSTYRPIFLANCTKSDMKNMRSSVEQQKSEVIFKLWKENVNKAFDFFV